MVASRGVFDRAQALRLVAQCRYRLVDCLNRGGEHSTNVHSFGTLAARSGGGGDMHTSESLSTARRWPKWHVHDHSLVQVLRTARVPKL